VVNSTTDTITEVTGQGNDTVESRVTFSINTTALQSVIENITLTGTTSGTTATGNWAANVENMTLTGSGNINAPTTTSNANNIIYGNSGNNTINGGSGDDTINGGGGTDSITGGLGADIYQYTSGGGADTINNVASDSLIDRVVFTDLASTSVTFSRTSNNLVATVAAGAGGGSVTVTNWFSATANRIDFLNFTNGEFTAAQVDAAVSGGGGLGFQAGGLETMAVPASSDPISIRSFHEIAASGLAESSITLGGKLAADEAAGRRWVPIKAFPNDPTTIGVNRLVDAMAAFGEDSGVTGDLAGSDALQAHALE
jgi:hypothetical protein